MLDAERDALITQREYVENEKQSRALAAEIVMLGNQADVLENQAREIYRRAWISDVVVDKDTDWDRTPMPKDMPVIDFDKIEEIEF